MQPIIEPINPAIYGAYVLGRHFYFGVLEGKRYAFSDAFTATQTAIYEIFGILDKLKVYVDEIV